MMQNSTFKFILNFILCFLRNIAAGIEIGHLVSLPASNFNASSVDISNALFAPAYSTVDSDSGWMAETGATEGYIEVGKLYNKW